MDGDKYLQKVYREMVRVFSYRVGQKVNPNCAKMCAIAFCQI